MSKYLNKFGFLTFICLLTLTIQSCDKDFLDVVPDNVATIDNAFSLRNEAEKYLFSCYSYIPKESEIDFNLGMFAGDELWMNSVNFTNNANFQIAKGEQNVGSPLFNSWDGLRYGGGPGSNYNLFQGIRKCNTFIKNVSDESQVRDLQSSERKRWLAEAKFLKAYYHYYLLRMYGPIPITDKNIPIEASTDKLNVRRQPFDSCVTYVSNLLDEAAADLPESIKDVNNELGRVTQPIALGIKAKLLTMAASPLFNGNPDYANFVDNEGTQLMSTSKDPNKWKLAADASLAAIQSAESAGAKLFYFQQNQQNLSDTTLTKMSIRQAICTRWNREIIWGNPNSRARNIQFYAMPILSPDYPPTTAQALLSPPLKIAKMFYTKNGVPMNEDKTLNFDKDTDLKTATEDYSYNIEEGYTTARINFDREPRFYADLGFDGSTFYKTDSPSGSDEDTWVIRAKYGQYSGSNGSVRFNVTGYFVKKLIDRRMTVTSGAPYHDYPWPMLRLSDLYLLYAEALNEVEGPTAPVLKYIDLVRKRAGLKGVAESWTDYSTNPGKYTTKAGMREIIHRERNIELAFEGKRYWDTRRWKEAAEEFNQPIQGWNYFGKSNLGYYQVSTLFQQRFVAPRDYLWPIREQTLLQNPNLVQNPGW